MGVTAPELVIMATSHHADIYNLTSKGGQIIDEYCSFPSIYS